MKEYVVIHARRIDENACVECVSNRPWDDVLLVHKNRPAWQAGRLNLVGGKVEEGEDAIAAAVRELKEEAGLDPLKNQPIIHCGTIIGNQSLVYCVRIDVSPYIDLQPREGETEKVEWFTFKNAWSDSRLIPNLKIIVPLMNLGVTGWKIIDQSSSSDLHEVIVQLPISKPFQNESEK